MRARAVYGLRGSRLLPHAQLVRYTEDDAPTVRPAVASLGSGPGTTRTWGTRRIGPDLAPAVGPQVARDWQVAHRNRATSIPRLDPPCRVIPGSTQRLASKSPARSPRPRGGIPRLARQGHALLAGAGTPSRQPPADPEVGRMVRSGLFEHGRKPATGPAPMFPAPADLSTWLPLAGHRGAAVFRNTTVGVGTGRRVTATESAAPALLPAPRPHCRRLLRPPAQWTSSGTASPVRRCPAGANSRAADLRARHVRPVPDRRDTVPDDQPIPSAADLTANQTLYDQNCSLCHGKTGAGDGMSAGVSPPADGLRVNSDQPWLARRACVHTRSGRVRHAIMG